MLSRYFLLSFFVILPYFQDTWAETFYRSPCNGWKIINEETIGKSATPKTSWIPEIKEHDQDTTPACGIHSTTLLLSALADKYLSVVDAIHKMGHTLENRIEDLSVLSFFKNHRQLTAHIPGWSVASVVKSGSFARWAEIEDHKKQHVFLTEFNVRVSKAKKDKWKPY